MSEVWEFIKKRKRGEKEGKKPQKRMRPTPSEAVVIENEDGSVTAYVILKIDKDRLIFSRIVPPKGIAFVLPDKFLDLVEKHFFSENEDLKEWLSDSLEELEREWVELEEGENDTTDE